MEPINYSGIRLIQTCEACPEQYDAVDSAGRTVGYLRLRWGHFSVECPDEDGEVVYQMNFHKPCGVFPSHLVRYIQLRTAARSVAAWLSNHPGVAESQ